ncbi:uncharacterized protein V6R79_013683 [Siganus canaliculatus]
MKDHQQICQEPDPQNQPRSINDGGLIAKHPQQSGTRKLHILFEALSETSRRWKWCKKKENGRSHVDVHTQSMCSKDINASERTREDRIVRQTRNQRKKKSGAEKMRKDKRLHYRSI